MCGCTCVCAYVNNQLNYRQTRLGRRRPNLRLQCPNRYSGAQDQPFANYLRQAENAI